jgi:hypothetical protein
MLHAIWHRIKWAILFIAVALAFAAYAHVLGPVAHAIGSLLGGLINGGITIIKGGVHGAHIHVPKPKFKP